MDKEYCGGCGSLSRGPFIIVEHVSGAIEKMCPSCLKKILEEEK